MEKLEYFLYILLFEFNRGAKAMEAARNICAVYGEYTIGECTASKWFFRFKEDRFDISDTPCSGRPSGFDEVRLNTLFHIDPPQCNSRTGKCDELWPFHHHATFSFIGQGSEIGCIGTACSKPKPQKSVSGHMCISVCSSSIGSCTTSTIPILHRFVSLG